MKDGEEIFKIYYSEFRKKEVKQIPNLVWYNYNIYWKIVDVRECYV